ncbi:hypothetical protein Dvina_01455 [Dactylosporangium vinaceum]|uniref:Uncharacterized protein n=1 Tax=Dactylosporangium vinaceum TaxID=53362 RepID=A0ABV5MLM0_9ACTN|nr:hypothetical protein [Dactylosporangium vinaceum]UAB96925.1 hypothetical protein Dvina_01455 [Dactylosporangium vinaceum]
MSDTEIEADEALTLSAQNLQAAPVLIEGVWLLHLSDGEQSVEITPEIGDPSAAAMALDDLAMAAGQAAEQIRRAAGR